MGPIQTNNFRCESNCPPGECTCGYVGVPLAPEPSEASLAKAATAERRRKVRSGLRALSRALGHDGVPTLGSDADVIAEALEVLAHDVEAVSFGNEISYAALIRRVADDLKIVITALPTGFGGAE